MSGDYSRIGILRKQVFFFDINKIVRALSEILWGARYMSNELIFQISASWVIRNITARLETDFEESPKITRLENPYFEALIVI